MAADTRPDLLIYLEVSQAVAGQRRKAESQVTWWDKLTQRLQHARQHADLCIQTDDLCMEEVLSVALAFLRQGTGRSQSFEAEEGRLHQ